MGLFSFEKVDMSREKDAIIIVRREL